MSQVNIQGGTIQGLDKLETKVGGHTQLGGRRTGIGMSKRYELTWTAGEHGKPSLNADLIHGVGYLQALSVSAEIADQLFEILGTNMTTALVTRNVEGGLTLTTAGGANDQAIIVPHLITDLSQWETVTWGTDKEVEWECWLKSGVSIASTIIWAGLKLTNTDVKVTDADQVFFRYEAGVNSGKWETVFSIGGTDTVADAGIAAVAVSTQYHLKITIDTLRIARMYVNDVLVATSTALTDTTDLKPYIGVRGVSKAIDTYGQAISRIAG